MKCGQDASAAVAGRLLHDMLATRPRYVRTWRVHGGRQRAEVNQRAVARVLALYLWDRGLRPDTDVKLPERLKNVVNRALRGERLTASTLECFVGAFDMDEDDQRSLWRAYTGIEGVSHTVVRPPRMAKRQWHRTIALFERYYVGDSGLLKQRRTVQCIEAREDGVDSYFFFREPSAMQIEVIHGGSVGRHYELEGFVVDEIILDCSLRRNERASLEYVTRYENDKPQLEVRRAARGRTENVTMAVHFDHRKVPRRVLFSTWRDHYFGEPLTQEQTVLSASGTVSVCIPFIEQTVVGFHWQW